MTLVSEPAQQPDREKSPENAAVLQKKCPHFDMTVDDTRFRHNEGICLPEAHAFYDLAVADLEGPATRDDDAKESAASIGTDLVEAQTVKLVTDREHVLTPLTAHVSDVERSEESIRRIRVLCPGASSAKVEALPNGARAYVEGVVDLCGPFGSQLRVIDQEFRLDQAEGWFELSHDECLLQHGLLLIVLRRAGLCESPKLERNT
jgi:hypothetical protein